MSNKRNPTNFSGLDIQGLDVDVRQTLLQGAVPNKSALTAKQRWDRKRPVYTSQFDWGPVAPEAWMQRIRAHLDALKRRKNWGVK